MTTRSRVQGRLCELLKEHKERDGVQTEREDKERRLKGALVETRTIMCYVKQKRAEGPIPYSNSASS